MTGALDYLVLAIVHRTNEDWDLELPLTIESLTGASAVCILRNTQGDEIQFTMTIIADGLRMQAQSEIFATKSGPYSGDVLLTLPGGRDFVTHLINLDLRRGVSRRA